MGRPAVFWDRDGTLIEDRGDIADPSQAVLAPRTKEALARLRDAFEFFIVTNQSGVARGTITREQAEAVSAHVSRELGVREVYTCPHRADDACECRKPKPFFLHKAEREHGIDLARSWVVGDHPSDAELAVATGARGVYVLSGHGAKHRADLKVACAVVDEIGAAAEHIACAHAADLLRAGGLVAFPTETVYGLGADAENAAAVRRIFAVKGRPETHPLIVHVAGGAALDGWAAAVPDVARRLAARFWPGPLTMILRRAARVPDAVTGGQATVGLRVPAHPLALAMLRLFGGGVAAPSANRFGRVSPTTAQHVRDDLGGDADYVLDGGTCAVGVESTIVDLTGPEPAILRPGGVTREALEAEVGRAVPVRAGGEVRAAGMLASHYAPRAEVVLASPDEAEPRAAALRAQGRRATSIVFRGSAEEAAHALYAALREVDAGGFEVVVVGVPDERGLGLAIADRLRKAAHR
jgi:L-threonylcarbamoyladenylate synthase